MCRCKRLVVLLTLVLLPWMSANAEQRLVVKYRQSTVDVDKPYFETLDTSASSWIAGAWYDKSNRYMIINLKGTNYHYCGLDSGTWEQFKTAESFGQEYNASIKGNFDCRKHPQPTYQ